MTVLMKTSRSHSTGTTVRRADMAVDGTATGMPNDRRQKTAIAADLAPIYSTTNASTIGQPGAKGG